MISLFALLIAWFYGEIIFEVIPLGQVKHLVVAKMDGDQNSSPLQEEFSWTSYPHIFFVKAEFVAIRHVYIHLM